jgi:hypothetical protein
VSLARLSFLDALVAYPGGKRKLLGHVFKHIPAPAHAPVLADAFTGGGSIALYAKLRGYVVHTNDLALRSVIAGRALVQNDDVTLSSLDVARLFVPDEGNTGFVEQTFCPDVVTTPHARFLDNALAVARRASEPKRWLLMQLALKVLTELRPAGNYGARSIVEQAEDGRWDEMNPSFVRGFVPTVTAHPSVLAERARVRINRGVIRGAGPCRANQQDAREFLATVDADVAYLDPPYGPSVLAYETALRTVDCILAGREVTAEKSDFSTDRYLKALDELIDACRHIPLVVLSFSNASTDLETLAALMERHDREVEAEALHYAHMAGLASAESRVRNQEFIVTGRKR